ncbi:MAG: hypothetical protein HY392_01560 [Candidatus Diapherotrites archaeon]|nr:hypothetical protein [Candidatus Diapherotrites archaeon]
MKRLSAEASVNRLKKLLAEGQMRTSREGRRALRTEAANERRNRWLEQIDLMSRSFEEPETESRLRALYDVRDTKRNVDWRRLSNSIDYASDLLEAQKRALDLSCLYIKNVLRLGYQIPPSDVKRVQDLISSIEKLHRLLDAVARKRAAAQN